MNFINRSIENKNFLAHAVAGFLTAYLALTPEALILKNDATEDTYKQIDIGNQYLMNPIIYTISIVAIFYLVLNFLPEDYHKYWIVGLFIGIFVPTFKMINNYAVKTYKITPTGLYLWDGFVYTLFYIFVIGPLLENI